MVPRSRRWGIKQLANILRDKSVPLKLEKNIIINIFMAILVTTLCEHADKHGRSRRPTAAMWPQSRRRDTLQSANILRNKFTSLNLENIIVIYTIMTIKVEHMLCQMVKNCTITSCRHGGFPWAKMEDLFMRVFGGSPTFWLTGGDVLNEQQRSCDAIGLNKNASRIARGGFISRWRGQKSTIFVSRKKSRKCLPGGGEY